MSEETLDRIRTVICQKTGRTTREGLEAETKILGGGLGLNSVAALEVLLAIENEFGLELEPDDLESEQALRNLGALAAFVEKRTGPSEV